MVDQFHFASLRPRPSQSRKQQYQETLPATHHGGLLFQGHYKEAGIRGCREATTIDNERPRPLRLLNLIDVFSDLLQCLL